MGPSEREAAEVAEYAVQAAEDDEPVAATAVVHAWPVWWGLPSKRSVRRAIAGPLLLVLTDRRAIGIRLVADALERGYTEAAGLEFAAPRGGLLVVRRQNGPLTLRADLVVPSRSMLIHARAPRPWRPRVEVILDQLETGTRVGGETVLR